VSQQLFLRAIKHVRAGNAPSDEISLDVSLYTAPHHFLNSCDAQTLTVFLESVLNKKFSSPSSDIISVLAGLEGVDATFAEFAVALDLTIRDGRTRKMQSPFLEEF